MKKYILLAYSLVLYISLFCQKNTLQYDAIWMKYNEFKLQGVQQKLNFLHTMNNHIGLIGSVLVGTGKGVNISNDFQKDYILFSQANAQNIPPFLQFEYAYFKGVVNLNRISSGLLNETGYSLGVFFKIFESKKMIINSSVSYGSIFNTFSVRDNVFDIKVSSTGLSDFKNYRIIYPSPIIIRERQDLAVLQANLMYQFFKKIRLGVTPQVQIQFEDIKVNHGFGVTIQLKL